jgi:BirA family biotin operon repressor/biotin-[acetyl-CoA-carboxylase] ligase
MDLAWRVARSLGDGAFHSGQVLAGRSGVSRGSIWNAIRALRARGMVIHAVRGKGYRLPAPVDWLESGVVLDAMPGDVRDCVGRLVVLQETASTNAWLLDSEPLPAGQAAVCLADYQTHGRGRRGRSWLAPPGAGICLLVGWQFQRPPARLQALGIAAGLGIRRALSGAGIDGVLLKWPNDLLWADCKLGGILVELRAEGNGPVHVVAGLGLNYRLPESAAELILADAGLVPIDLAAACAAGVPPPGRNRLAGAMAGALVRLFRDFRELAPELLERDWAAADAIAGRPVNVSFGDHELSGVAAGIDADGALILERGDGLLRVTAGDVTLRMDA